MPHDAPSAVIIAAGEGRRAGGYKPLWNLGGVVVIDRVIAAAASVCDEIRVVGGSSFEDLERHIGPAHPGVILVNNADWKEGGMFSSIRCGLEGLDGPAFVHPADIPGVSGEVYRALSSAMIEETAEVYRPSQGGRPGHPVLLSRSAVGSVMAATADSTLRDVLATLGRVDVPVDDELIHFDVDTGEDFDRLALLLSRR